MRNHDVAGQVQILKNRSGSKLYALGNLVEADEHNTPNGKFLLSGMACQYSSERHVLHTAHLEHVETVPYSTGIAKLEAFYAARKRPILSVTKRKANK